MEIKQALILVGHVTGPTHPGIYHGACLEALRKQGYHVETIHEDPEEPLFAKHLATYDLVLILGDGNQFLKELCEARSEGIKVLTFYIYQHVTPGILGDQNTLFTWMHTLDTPSFETTFTMMVAAQMRDWQKRVQPQPSPIEVVVISEPMIETL